MNKGKNGGDMEYKIRYWLDTNEWGQYDSPNIKTWKTRLGAEMVARKLSWGHTGIEIKEQSRVYFITWTRIENKMPYKG